MQKVSVLLPTNNDDTYYYFVSKDMHVSLGTFVKVPFRNKIMLGQYSKYIHWPSFYDIQFRRY